MENLIHENFRNGTDRPERKIEFNGTDFAYIKVLEQQLYVEEANNEMLVQECNNQRQIIDRLINALRSLYNHVDSPLEPMYEFSLKNARDLIQQYEDGFL